MKKNLFRGLLVAALGAFAMSGALADDHGDEPPFIPGDYWEVTGIKLADGGGLKYARWLAGEWRKDSDFAVSKGWLKDYYIISNEYPRADEADLYIIRVFESFASVEEGEKRRKEYMAWAKKSMEKMQAESGNRAEYRTVLSSSLMRHMKFRN